MSRFRRILPLLTVCAFSLFLTGCGNGWLIGKWTLDKPETLAQMEAAKPAESEQEGGLLKNVLGGLQKGVSHLLLTQFEGTTIEFTSSEMRMMRNGSGEAQTYKVIERPASGSIVVQYQDGDISTIEKTDTGIRTLLSGESEMWIYFKRAE